MTPRTTGLAAVMAVLLFAAPLTAPAQQAGKVARLGVLCVRRPSQPNLAAFKDGLRELGWVEGQTLIIEDRCADGKYDDRFLALTSELVRLNVDVIFASGYPSALAAKKATSTIPIVFETGDMLDTKFVAEFLLPGGNLTGVEGLASELSLTQLALLTEVVPTATSIAVFADNDPVTRRGVRDVKAVARALRLKLAVYEPTIRSRLEYTLRTVIRRRPDGLVVQQTSANRTYQKEIVAFAASNRLPAVYAISGAAEAGGLMSYAPTRAEGFRRAATLVDRILKGAKPADLPVEHPTKFELVINLRTAKALGLTIPRSLLLRADRVVE